MKKTTIFIIFLLLIISLIWGDNQSFSKLLNFYSQGKIKLQEIENFGSKIDWIELNINKNTRLTRSKKGMFYLVKPGKHNISILSQNGDLIKTFGQKGEGPGDLYGPQNPTILDNKYLIVGEHALTRRISVFDLKGSFIKKTRTQGTCYSATALSKDKIAYLSITHKGNYLKAKITQKVFIKDIHSSSEILIKTKSLDQNTTLKVGEKSSMTMLDLLDDFFITRSHSGDLIIGSRYSHILEIYTIRGQKIKEINLPVKPISVNGEYIDKYKSIRIKGMKADTEKRRNFIKSLKKIDFSGVFLKTLPLIERIIVDSEGNFLIMHYDRLESKSIVIDILKPDGQFLKRILIDKGDYHFSYKLKLIVDQEGLFSILGREIEDDDILFKLRRFKID